MFVLRKINGSGIQSNICLNKVYNLVNNYDVEQFQRAYSAFTHGATPTDDCSEEKIYAFIIYDEGSRIEPLYKAQKNFIMMSDGKTFANISYK